MKVIVRKLLNFTVLSKSPNLYIHKLRKAFIVHNNDKLLFVPFKVVLLVFESFNYSQKLIVESFISSFGLNYFSKK